MHGRFGWTLRFENRPGDPEMGRLRATSRVFVPLAILQRTAQVFRDDLDGSAFNPTDARS